jgi:hypothetical protein
MAFQFRAFGTLSVVAGMALGGLSGCTQGNNSEVSAPPPEVKITPQVPAKAEDVPKGATPSHSSTQFDSARGGTPPK